MQVLPVRERPDSGPWSYEAKLDGWRCLAANHGALLCAGPGAELASPKGFHLSMRGIWLRGRDLNPNTLTTTNRLKQLTSRNYAKWKRANGA